MNPYYVKQVKKYLLLLLTITNIILIINVVFYMTHETALFCTYFVDKCVGNFGLSIVLLLLSLPLLFFIYYICKFNYIVYIKTLTIHMLLIICISMVQHFVYLIDTKVFSNHYKFSQSLSNNNSMISNSNATDNNTLENNLSHRNVQIDKKNIENTSLICTSFSSNGIFFPKSYKDNKLPKYCLYMCGYFAEYIIDSLNELYKLLINALNSEIISSCGFIIIFLIIFLIVRKIFFYSKEIVTQNDFYCNNEIYDNNNTNLINTNINNYQQTTTNTEKNNDIIMFDTISNDVNAENINNNANVNYTYNDVNINYIYPNIDTLKDYEIKHDEQNEIYKQQSSIIEKSFADFGIKITVEKHIVGPRVTRYEINIPNDISVKHLFKYDVDLKIRLSSVGDIRIAPIAGSNRVGIEVPNKNINILGVKNIIYTIKDKIKDNSSSLYFALGVDSIGNPIYDDLIIAPHILICGTTGSGKSVSMHTIICSLMMLYSPNDVKLILVDPKTTEFKIYENTPHLLINEIFNKYDRIIKILSWCYIEMEGRNAILSKYHVNNIDDYNKLENINKMFRIVVVIDELADLMSINKKDITEKITLLAQKSRSVGIHLIISTQYPVVQIISGALKANLPTRMAFKVNTSVESVVAINNAGAEKLLGNGDMLYKNAKMSDYERYQGAYISYDEIINLVNDIKQNNQSVYNDNIVKYLNLENINNNLSNVIEQNKILFRKALICGFENNNHISTSFLQRQLNLGYAKAGFIIDNLEKFGLISKLDNNKSRELLITNDEFHELIKKGIF